ncbi:MAG: NUDIX hydrolase [Gloeomargaritaceae cyanobacterium C42_A2020_066]|nr:NUDIX hydrolase [Gloeomargaritaceae cyanobacterium C42_A2020_066]
MPHAPAIRVLALGLIQDGDRLFLSEGYDPVKQRTFYRALGGGVDFGETSHEALEREFREEIQADLTDIQYLGCLENLFTFNGRPGHEIIQLYRCRFADPDFYTLQSITFQEGNRQKLALWVPLAALRSEDLTVVPTNFLQYVMD